jgi:hypothetical protein
MNEFTKGGGNGRGLAATDPTLNDRLDDPITPYVWVHPDEER